MTDSPFEEKPVRANMPVILSLDKSALLAAINMARDNDQLEPIPPNAEISVFVPGGGDFSNMQLEVGEHNDPKLDIRWEVPA